MPTVSEYYRHNMPTDTVRTSPHLISDTRVGIEVELEGFHSDQPKVRGWNTIPDGSLRDGGLEFVFNGPVGGVTAMTRLTALGEVLGPYQEDIKCSERTSLHVHVDVRELELGQVWLMLVLYGLVEPYLFTVCGEHRADNIYSLAWYKGEHQLSNLSALSYNNGFRATGDSEMFPKYATVNIGALNTFGSLEFRGHEGTATIDQMTLWVNHLLALKEYVLGFQHPCDGKGLLDQSFRLGAEDFLRDVFGDLLTTPIDGESYEKLMDIGKSVAIDLLFSRELDSAAHEVPTNFRSDQD
jgi:hypothetical protein